MGAFCARRPSRRRSISRPTASSTAILRLPYSRDDSAWGSVMIPITVIRNGAGPTALLTGGNHGDEYEGPIALFELARTLSARGRDRPRHHRAGDELSGLAWPARAPRRSTRATSIAAFPAGRTARVTEKIADYFTRHLLPLADHRARLPFGRPHARLPALCGGARAARQGAGAGAASRRWRPSARPTRCGCSRSIAVGMYDTTAEAMGKIFVTTELGGGGTSTARSIGIARRGVRTCCGMRASSRARLHQRRRAGSTCRRPTASASPRRTGLVEPCVDLGDPVRSGELLARIHPIGRTGRRARRAPGRARRRPGGATLSRPRQARRLPHGDRHRGGRRRRPASATATQADYRGNSAKPGQPAGSLTEAQLHAASPHLRRSSSASVPRPTPRRSNEVKKRRLRPRRQRQRGALRLHGRGRQCQGHRPRRGRRR